MTITGIIPARYESTRFPGKPLADIQGKTMIRRVYEQALQASSLSDVTVATDDQRIFEHVLDFGGKAVMTSSEHRSGTDRCFEALTLMGKSPTADDVVINIQGDEPYIHPEQINEVAALFKNKDTVLGTLAKKITSPGILFDPNKPKVLLDNQNRAIYFSRQALPYVKGVSEDQWIKHHDYYKHIGIYGYRADILETIVQLPPSSLEKTESLEQLRWIQHGYAISVGITTYESAAIDTPEDVEKLRL